MKVTVSPNGEVTVDTDDAAEAARFVAALRNGAAPKKKRAPREKTVETIDLSPALAETWDWLVANNAQGGRSTAEVADALNVKHATATWRVNALIDKGLAYRVRRGYYRAGEK